MNLRVTGRQVANLKPAAGPGGSGWRNSHVQCLYADPAGPSSVMMWAQIWANGSISPWLAQLWTGALARPFWKDAEHTKIRPVLCGEVLLKVAIGIASRAAEKQLGVGVGPRQFGAGRAAGAAAEVAEVRAAAAAYPDSPILTLDVKNAFGEVSWPVALKAALRRAPLLAVPLAAMWRAGSALVFTMKSCGTAYHAFEVFDKLIQGNIEGAPGFCLVICCVLLDVESDARLLSVHQSIRHWQYIDDWVVQCPRASLGTFVFVVNEKLAEYGLPLQSAKCTFHVPSLAGIAQPNLPEDLRHVADSIAYSSDSITLLGTEACREQATPLRISEALPRHTQQRVDKALRLAARITEMVQLAPPAGAKQAAFALTRCVVAHSLDYDACVVPCSIMLPHARLVDQAVIDVIALTLDTTSASLPATARAQLCLPQRHGGLQVDLPSSICPLARTAHLVERGPDLRTQMAAWAEKEPFPDGMVAADFDGVDAALADGLMELLQSRSIFGIHGTGKPAVAALEAPPGQQLRPPAPDRHLLSTYLKSTAAACQAKMLLEASASERVRLHSTAGPTAGVSLVAPLSLEGVHFADWQWTEALKWRLGLPFEGPQGSCRNEKANGDECGEALAASGDHPIDCPCGPLSNARHDELADVYADVIEEAGGLARREVYVHELSGSREAWLDVWGYAVLEMPDILLDITVRHPRASRYRPDSEETPGAAASKAEGEKQQRYPATSGRSIWPLVHESWGRLGGIAEVFLQSCAAAARRHAHRRGKVSGNELRRWRARLDGALQRAVATQQLSARRGLPGRSLRRRRPLDLQVLEANAVV